MVTAKMFMWTKAKGAKQLSQVLVKMARLGSHLAWQVLLLASSGVLIRSEEAKMTMPGARPAYADSYLCSTFSTKSLLTTNQVGVSYITGFRPIADAGVSTFLKKSFSKWFFQLKSSRAWNCLFFIGCPSHVASLLQWADGYGRWRLWLFECGGLSGPLQHYVWMGQKCTINADATRRFNARQHEWSQIFRPSGDCSKLL